MNTVRIDTQLLDKAHRLSGLRTKRDTVHAALEQFIRTREQLKILDLAGTIEYYPDYDHKEGRRRR